ncbi:hypothetical protein GOM49_16070 [Clostridium bovifaecis]|uniref:Type I restriction modification DNA specificity domain-containing protein n=1 Tax=Clostridium bovifaecis TaxID=2184719 RepID=A0A6I6F7E9_9CLOT|nr:hypothetical protein GOM49_16070 [Clostridium bovifaecis]
MSKQIREGYKMTELGEIPVEWEIKKLEEIAEIIMGQSPDSSSYNEEGQGIPFFQGKTEFGSIYPEVKKWCTQPTKTAKPLDILMSVRAPVGDVNINNIESCIGRGLSAIRASKNSNYRYIYYFLQQNNKQLERSSQGSTFTAINNSDLKNLYVIVPPLIEQEKIASILSTIDEHIEQVDGLIEKTKELKKGLMQRLLTKGIGHTEFKMTEIGMIPKEWEVKKISEVAEIVSGGTPSTTKSEYWNEGTIFWATPTDITSSKKYISNTEKLITDKGLRDSSANLLPVGSILMTSRATIGEKCINTVPMATNQGFKSFICNDNFYNEFMYYLIDTIKDKMISLASGSTFLELSKSTVSDFSVVCPSLTEQRKIAEILSEVDNQIEQYESKKEKIETLKKGLMQKLLTGKIRISM